MTRIPLLVQRAVGGPKPFAYVVVYAPQYKIRGKRIRLFLDTGANDSTICETDAKLLGIVHKKLEKPRTFKGVTGCTIDGYPLQNVTLRFRDEDDNVISIDIPEIYALKCTQKSKTAIEASKSIPSILGVQFLLDEKFKFFYDPSNRIAYIERDDET